MRSGRLVEDHHRTTERHTPQPARVSLAELRGLLEPSLSELRLDLAIGRRCGAKQREQRQSVEMVSNLHRPLPLPKPTSPSKVGALPILLEFTLDKWRSGDHLLLRKRPVSSTDHSLLGDKAFSIA